MIKVLSFLFGILFYLQQSSLEYIFIVVAILIFGIIVSVTVLKKYARFVIIFTLGYIFTFGYYHLFYKSIPTKYFNTSTQTIGTIEQVIHSQYSSTIIFNTEFPYQAKLRLNVYDDTNQISLNSGDKWQFEVKLKTPHSFFNDGSFDYERYLFSQRISGIGYVNLKKSYQFIKPTHHHLVNQLRQSIHNKLSTTIENLGHNGIIKAVTIGYKSDIKDDVENILQRTNTTHLSVISGLHIGMIAGFGFLMSMLIFNYSFITKSIPFPIIAAVVSLIFAGIYTLLAGLSLPTTRAFIMLGIFLIGVLCRTHYNRWQLFSLALLGVLLINPFTVLGADFYLSFGIVLVIIYYGEQFIKSQKLSTKLLYLVLMQIIISLFSGVMSIYFFGFFSIGSIISNLVAIPVFSIIVVPFSLIATAVMYLGYIEFAHLLFALVNISLDTLLVFLSEIADFKYLYTAYTLPSLWHILILAFAILLITSYPALKLLPLGVILLLIVLLKSESHKEFTVLDVGQGSASVLINESNAMIFDTGDKFRSGFSLANAVIIPFLQHKASTDIHTLIISHEDKDHSGGIQDIKQSLSPRSIIESHSCHEQTLNLNDYKVKIFSTDGTFKGNNASCVVQIITPDISILLSGDIEHQAEKYLVKKYQNELQSDVLIVPHHGSKSSSSKEFLQVVNPKLAIISSSYENRYRHPHNSIISRYDQLQIPLLNTACSGQISIDLISLEVRQKRLSEKKFYHHSCDNIPIVKDILRQ